MWLGHCLASHSSCRITNLRHPVITHGTSVPAAALAKHVSVPRIRLCLHPTTPLPRQQHHKLKAVPSAASPADRRQAPQAQSSTCEFMHAACTSGTHTHPYTMVHILSDFVSVKHPPPQILRKSPTTPQASLTASQHAVRGGGSKEQEQHARRDVDRLLAHVLGRQRTAQHRDARGNGVPHDRARGHAHWVLGSSQRDGGKHGPVPPLSDEDEGGGLEERLERRPPAHLAALLRLLDRLVSLSHLLISATSRLAIIRLQPVPERADAEKDEQRNARQLSHGYAGLEGVRHP
mmetsp:Transcript_27571/g.70239  ORF Transcript_27571/g.70239 Transcript_27571/m.70239 type:complete len:291 (-) Transcript_27571:715-1587(-)